LCFAIGHLANPSRLVSEEGDWNDLLDLHEKVINNRFYQMTNELLNENLKSRVYGVEGERERERERIKLDYFIVSCSCSTTN
jgi:hypothetical protein